ncbi:MAG: ribonuclease Z [Cyclobacteriaceae bacterium]
MSISVKILGSNSASFAHNRHHTSQIVQVQDQYIMIDCGEGTQIQCKRFGVKISRIDTILISHLHGDHYYGLMGLLSTMHLYGRQKTVTLIGPPGLSDIIKLQLRHSETHFNFHVDFREWVPDSAELVIDHPKMTIHTIPLDHRVPCSGYLIKEKPKRRRINQKILPEKLAPHQINALKNGEDILDAEGLVKYRNEDVTLPPQKPFSYAYCSDTKYRASVIEQIKGADILYHEATFMEDMRDRAENTYHTTAYQAGQIATEAEVRQLLIGHFSTRYRDLNPVLAEAKTAFAQTSLAIEGLIFDVKMIAS